MDKIEKMVNRINSLNHKRSNEVGALVHIKSMAENSICKIGNSYGGVIQLIYGEDYALCQYLENILKECEV